MTSSSVERSIMPTSSPCDVICRRAGCRLPRIVWSGETGSRRRTSIAQQNTTVARQPYMRKVRTRHVAWSWLRSRQKMVGYFGRMTYMYTRNELYAKFQCRFGARSTRKRVRGSGHFCINSFSKTFESDPHFTLSFKISIGRLLKSGGSYDG